MLIPQVPSSMCGHWLQIDISNVLQDMQQTWFGKMLLSDLSQSLVALEKAIRHHLSWEQIGTQSR